MPCEGPGFRLIQRPIWSGKFELHAHTSRRTVEVARAAGGVFPRSAGRPSPRDSHCSIGRPESRPGRNCAGSAQLPRTCKQGQIVRSKLALNFEHVHRQSFGECIARSAVLDFEGANERENLRRDAQMRLRPEIEGLRSDLSIRQHRQPPVRAPATRSALRGPIGLPADGRLLCPGTFLQAGGLNDRLRATTEGMNTWGSEQGKRAVRLSLGYCTATRLLFRLHGGRQLAALRDRPPKVPINARLGGEANFSLALE